VFGFNKTDEVVLAKSGDDTVVAATVVDVSIGWNW
jgi:hypothetical protein